jgi:hypothetical protein
MERSLGRSETLLYRAHFPWFYTAASWIILIACWIGAVVALSNDQRGPGIALLLLGVAVFLAIMVPIWTTEIGVTNQRFIYKRGLVWRSTHELQLRAIEEVNLEQGLLGRMFDFGHLELRGTGVDDIRLPALAEPLRLRKALQDGMAAAAAGQPGIIAAAAPAPADGVSTSAA